MKTGDSYTEVINLLEDFYSFHPEYFKKLSSEDMNYLSVYYFAGRKVDVDDVESYRNRVLKREPDLEKKAQKALDRFKEIANIRS